MRTTSMRDRYGEKTLPGPGGICVTCTQHLGGTVWRSDRLQGRSVCIAADWEPSGVCWEHVSVQGAVFALYLYKGHLCFAIVQGASLLCIWTRRIFALLLYKGHLCFVIGQDASLLCCCTRGPCSLLSTRGISALYLYKGHLRFAIVQGASLLCICARGVSTLWVGARGIFAGGLCICGNIRFCVCGWKRVCMCHNCMCVRLCDCKLGQSHGPYMLSGSELAHGHVRTSLTMKTRRIWMRAWRARRSTAMGTQVT
jgi:hypothetical protein